MRSLAAYLPPVHCAARHTPNGNLMLILTGARPNISGRSGADGGPYSRPGPVRYSRAALCLIVWQQDYGGTAAPFSPHTHPQASTMRTTIQVSGPTLQVGCIGCVSSRAKKPHRLCLPAWLALSLHAATTGDGGRKLRHTKCGRPHAGGGF